MGTLLEVELTKAQISIIEYALYAYGNGKTKMIRDEIEATLAALQNAQVR